MPATAELLAAVLALGQPTSVATGAFVLIDQRQTLSGGEGHAIDLQALAETAQTSAWLSRARDRLAALAALDADWSSYGERPNQIAVQGGHRLVDALATFGLRPKRLVPMAAGGIAVRFQSESRRARIELMNNGDIVLVTQDSVETEPQYQSASINDAARSLARYFD